MIPVNFSQVSYKAFEFLSQLKDITPVSITLVHVIEVNSADWTGSVETSDTIDKAGLREKEQVARQKMMDLQQEFGFQFTNEILFGGLTSTLANYASQHGTDLIIMGTHGSDGWHEKISGSEAQHLVRHTDIPVITIHNDAAITPVKNILWVADFEKEKQPEDSISSIKLLQNIFRAKLHLLQIIDKEDEERISQLKQKMKIFAEALSLQNFECHLHHNHKIPAGVRNFNEVSEMDLVMVGTHGRIGLSHLLFGSIAETLVNHCIRPLMTYHFNDRHLH